MAPFIFTFAVVVGQWNTESYDDRWCYMTPGEAVKALVEWDGTDEPKGWHRHPRSGRRYAEQDGEVDDMGKRHQAGDLLIRL